MLTPLPGDTPIIHASVYGDELGYQTLCRRFVDKRWANADSSIAPHVDKVTCYFCLDEIARRFESQGRVIERPRTYAADLTLDELKDLHKRLRASYATTTTWEKRFALLRELSAVVKQHNAVLASTAEARRVERRKKSERQQRQAKKLASAEEEEAAADDPRALFYARIQPTPPPVRRMTPAEAAAEGRRLPSIEPNAGRLLTTRVLVHTRVQVLARRRRIESEDEP